MIRNIYYQITSYQGVHPIRFWIIIIIGIIVLFSLLAYIINIIDTKNKNKDTFLKKTPLQDRQDTIIERVNKETKPSVFKNNKESLKIISVSSFLLMGITLAALNYGGTRITRSENLSISNSEYVFGIDVSHYQKRIDWKKMRTSHHPIEYVFIRATMGIDGKDYYFDRNWSKAKTHNYIRGAYHYYRPNENSTQQFENYSSSVDLIAGDFIPILDIERQSEFGKDNLRRGVLNWLKLAEEEYGVKPMIYTGLTFYQYNLKGYVDDYPLWIAAYSGKHRLRGVDWTFHQFTEKVYVKGVQMTVDGNDFKGELEDLHEFCIPF